MPEEFKTSFIPKKPLEGKRKMTSRRGLFSVLSTVLVVVAIIGAGGAFLYERFLDTSLERKIESLERTRGAFEPQLIEELSRLDRRIQSSRGLISGHTAPSKVFGFLEGLTMKNIQFQSFSLGEMPDGVAIDIRGIARDFSSVALQSDVFGDSQFLSEPLFSNLDVDAFGNITFDFSAILEPALLVYVPNTVVTPDTSGFPDEEGLDAFLDELGSEFEDLEGENPDGPDL